MAEEPTVTLRIPRSHWRQIVDDIENMCGTSEEEIEILSSVEVLEDAAHDQAQHAPTGNEEYVRMAMVGVASLADRGCPVQEMEMALAMLEAVIRIDQRAKTWDQARAVVELEIRNEFGPHALLRRSLLGRMDREENRDG